MFGLIIATFASVSHNIIPTDSEWEKTTPLIMRAQSNPHTKCGIYRPHNVLRTFSNGYLMSSLHWSGLPYGVRPNDKAWHVTTLLYVVSCT